MQSQREEEVRGGHLNLHPASAALPAPTRPQQRRRRTPARETASDTPAAVETDLVELVLRVCESQARARTWWAPEPPPGQRNAAGSDKAAATTAPHSDSGNSQRYTRGCSSRAPIAARPAVVSQHERERTVSSWRWA